MFVNLLRIIIVILLLPVYAFASIINFFRDIFGRETKIEFVTGLLDELIRLTIVENHGSQLTPLPRISFEKAREYARLKGARNTQYEEEIFSLDTIVDGRAYKVFLYRAELIGNHTEGIIFQVMSEEEHQAGFSPEMRKILFKDE